MTKKPKNGLNFITVPPHPVVIFDARDGSRRQTFVGPYEEGASLDLICDAFKGRQKERRER